MRIGIDIAQTCTPKAGCGWVAHCLAHEFLRSAPNHDYIWYHHFDSWINTSNTDGPVCGASRVEMPFRGMPADTAMSVWNRIRTDGIIPGAPDIVHAHSFNAPRLSGTKLIFTVHDVGFWTHPEYSTELNRMVCQRGLLDALANADGFYFTSEYSRSEFDTMLGGWLTDSGRSVLVHPLAPRHPAPAAEWTPPADGSWLFVGTLEPRKNLDGLLDAYAIYLQNSESKRPLRIVGSHGWKCEQLVQRILAFQPAGFVQHTGYLPEPDLLHEYRHAFALVFPSYHEGFGLPVLEAMQQKLPVICSRKSSLAEVGGDAACFVNTENPKELADAMLRLETDSSLHRDLSAASSAHASHFTWESLVHRLIGFYETVLNR